MDAFKSLKDHVYQYISEKINDGSLLPETKISEKTVINDLNISRTPVREAMIQLATEGYLENIPRRGFIVKPVDTQKAKEVYGILGVLDGYAASLALDVLTKEDLKEMRDLFARMEAALESNDIRSYYTFQNRFHDVYTRKCGNQELIKVIRQMKKIFIRQTYTAENGEVSLKKVLKTTNEDHRTIIELFEKKAGPELEQYLRSHRWHPRHAEYDTF